MPQYEIVGFVPPAPVAHAAVRGRTGQMQPDVPLLLDTGADVSLVPRHVAEAVGAEVHPSGVALRFYDGREAMCDVAELSVEVLHYRFQGAFVIVDAEHGVLGRNILNLLVLTLDGPQQVWSV